MWTEVASAGDVHVIDTPAHVNLLQAERDRSLLFISAVLENVHDVSRSMS